MHAGADAVKPLRDRAVAVFGGRNVEVDEWEIPFLHDVQRKATKHAIGLAAWHKVDPGQVDSQVERFKEFILSQMHQPSARDFRGAHAAVDRKSGRTLFFSSFDSAGEPYPALEPGAPLPKDVEQRAAAFRQEAGGATEEGLWFFDFGLGHCWLA